MVAVLLSNAVLKRGGLVFRKLYIMILAKHIIHCGMSTVQKDLSLILLLQVSLEG